MATKTSSRCQRPSRPSRPKEPVANAGGGLSGLVAARRRGHGLLQRSCAVPEDLLVLGCGEEIFGQQRPKSDAETTAKVGNDLATFPDFPSEIRAPAGTRAGVSGFQIHFSSRDIYTPGDAPSVLVAMNPAAFSVRNRALVNAAMILTIVVGVMLVRALFVPLELIRSADQGQWFPAFVRNQLFWMGFSVPMFIVLIVFCLFIVLVVVMVFPPWIC